jgi:hypothetical protein
MSVYSTVAGRNRIPGPATGNTTFLVFLTRGVVPGSAFQHALVDVLEADDVILAEITA